MAQQAAIDLTAGPRTDDAELNTRARLLRAAITCFARHGFDGTSMREIADAANVAQQLITYHFGSKEQLWVAVAETLRDEFLQTMMELSFDPDGDVIEQFREHQRIVFRDRSSRPHFSQIWTQEFLSGRERFRRILQPIMKQFGDSVSAPYFEQVVRLGITDAYSEAEVGLLCNALLQLSVLNPFFVERALGAPAGSPEAIEAQVDLLTRVLTGSARRNAGAASETSTADGKSDDDIAELKLVIAELTLENRRLRNRLASGDGDLQGSAED